jgi:hypothetical protein
LISFKHGDWKCKLAIEYETKIESYHIICANETPRNLKHVPNNLMDDTVLMTSQEYKQG